MNAPLTQVAAAAAQAATGDSELTRLLQGDYSPRYMLEGDSMDKMMRLAEQMATSKLSVPEHLRGNIGDCLAIITQAMLWNMNPFAVAQKTHIVSGRLGYEAQLVNAVVQNSGAVRGAPRYEYRGEGEQLECRVGYVLRGEAEPTFGEWLMFKSVTTRNSPLWKTNVKQQLGYLQVKNWARAFTPGAILGVYTVDELEDGLAQPTPRATAPAPSPAPKPELLTYTAEAFDAKLPEWSKLVTGKDGKTAQALLNKLRTRAAFTEEQKARILSLKPAAEDAKPAAAPAPADDFVADMEEAEAAQEGAK